MKNMIRVSCIDCTHFFYSTDEYLEAGTVRCPKCESRRIKSDEIPSQEQRKCCYRCYRDIVGCSDSNCPCHQPPQEDWVKEFEKLYDKSRSFEHVEPKKIFISFIQSLLDQKEKEVREKVLDELMARTTTHIGANVSPEIKRFLADYINQ